MAKKLNEPQLTPEREVRKRLEELAEEQKGTKRTTRGPSEEYISTCTCGGLQITSSFGKVLYFEYAHKDCPSTKSQVTGA